MAADMTASAVLWCRLLLLTVLSSQLVIVASHVLYPAWQQYYPIRKWAFYDEQVHGRPARVRVGRGRYRLLSVGAELMCDFPPYLHLVSNVIWERADLGDRSSLNHIYSTFGLPHEFSVHMRPGGSTLHLLNAGPLDKGLYRCMVSAVDTASGHRSPRPLTVFQDVEFFPRL